MKIIINGEPKSFTAPLDIAAMLQQEGYGDKLVAVARNGEFVPRGEYANTNIQDGDTIDIVAPMQGG